MSWGYIFQYITTFICSKKLRQSKDYYRKEWIYQLPYQMCMGKTHFIRSTEFFIFEIYACIWRDSSSLKLFLWSPDIQKQIIFEQCAWWVSVWVCVFSFLKLEFLMEVKILVSTYFQEQISLNHSQLQRLQCKLQSRKIQIVIIFFWLLHVKH